MIVAPRPFADRYDIGARLGGGTFGTVYRAWDRNQEMEVALKIFAPGTALILAYPEARILTTLKGHHVLEVYNADSYQDVPYIATKIVAGGSAEDKVVAAAHGIRPDFAVTWARHMLIGLRSCHARGLLHRDIKPANLFLERVDWGLLGDFGIAHPLDPTGHAPAQGTPVTKSPEMFSTGSGTVVSDVYSVGVTLYRLLTGEWPFFAPTPAGVEPLVLAGNYVRVRDAAPHVTQRLADRVERAMSLDPTNRYQSAQAFHDELARPGIVDRYWERTVPHAGHARCWTEHRSRPGALHQVCVIAGAPGRFEIETRRIGGTRLIDHCATVRSRELAARLRRNFNSV